jgi:hypothetical protein
MAYEIRENTGSTFKNQKKETDKHPNVTGSCLIDGKEYWMSGWTKQDKNGNAWQSWAFKTKEEKQEAKPNPKSNKIEDMEEDIPW